MKTGYIILIVVLILAVIGVIIWAANKAKKDREALEKARAEGGGEGEFRKANIWDVIGGLAGVLGGAGVGQKA